MGEGYGEDRVGEGKGCGKGECNLCRYTISAGMCRVRGRVGLKKKVRGIVRNRLMVEVG